MIKRMLQVHCARCIVNCLLGRRVNLTISGDRSAVQHQLVNELQKKLQVNYGRRQAVGHKNTDMVCSDINHMGPSIMTTKH